jgi:hypothetical protein
VSATATISGEIGTLTLLAEGESDPAYFQEVATGSIHAYSSYGPFALPAGKQLVGIQAQTVGGDYLTDVALVFASTSLEAP